MLLTRFISSYFLLIGCFCHLLCCGVPFTLSILSISVNAGLPSFLYSNLPIEKIEPVLIIFSTIILLMLILSEIHTKKIDCSNEDNCINETCDSKKKKITINLYLSSILYFFNLIFFSLERL